MSEAVPSETVAPERRAPRWMWIALVLSLGFNLLVAGVVASAAWHITKRDGFGFHGRLSSFLSTLPEDRAESLRKFVDRSRSEIRPLRQEIRQMKRDTAQLFAAEPLDKAALTDASTRLLDSDLKLRQSYALLMTELAENMTVEERRAFIEWRDRHRRTRGQHRSGERDDRADR